MKYINIVLLILACISSAVLIFIWAASYLETEADGKFNEYKLSDNRLQNYAIKTVIHQDVSESYDPSLPEDYAEELRSREPGESVRGFIFTCIQFALWIVLHIMASKLVHLDKDGKEIFSSRLNIFTLLVLIWNAVIYYGLFLTANNNIFDVHQYVQ